MDRVDCSRNDRQFSTENEMIMLHHPEKLSLDKTEINNTIAQNTAIKDKKSLERQIYHEKHETHEKNLSGVKRKAIFSWSSLFFVSFVDQGYNASLFTIAFGCDPKLTSRPSFIPVAFK
jgi:hypothetical protein